MEQKYEVFVEGKPVWFGQQEDLRGLPGGWLGYRLEGPGELANALTALARREVHGVFLMGDTAQEAFAGFRSAYKPVTAAGGVVSDEQGRLLVIKRLGVWDLPKGKVDKGEAIDAAALREVQEECGLARPVLGPKLCETWHTYERKGRSHLKCTHWYLMEATSDQPLVAQAEEDIEEVRWVEPAEVARIAEGSYASLAKVFNAWAALPRRRT